MKKETSLVPIEIIERRIYLIRGVKVMLDRDLALLYGVKPIALRQQVKRNKDRFPADFIFQLTQKEAENLVSQNVIPSKQSFGGYLPYVFTEQGVAMLSAVLKSKRAVQMSIMIVRAFIKLREMLATHKNLIREFEKMKRTQKEHGQHIINILNVISQLLNPPTEPPKEPIGFRDREKN
jgi:phage regulator Rha-like protein